MDHEFSTSEIRRSQYIAMRRLASDFREALRRGEVSPLVFKKNFSGLGRDGATKVPDK
jgi:hypothetical protein